MKIKIYIDPNRFFEFVSYYDAGHRISFAKAHRRNEFSLEIEIDVDNHVEFNFLHAFPVLLTITVGTSGIINTILD